jgi:hypothetical protein
MRFVWRGFRFLLLLPLLFAACDDPTVPIDPPPGFPQMDSTSHEYSWEYVFIGRAAPVNSLFAVHAINDTDVWIIGKIPLQDTIRTIPSGVSSRSSNVMHWNGRRLEFYTIEGTIGENKLFPVLYNDILGIDGRIRLMTGVGYTELLRDSVRIVQFKSYRTMPYYRRAEKGRSGRIYLWGPEEGVAYLPTYSSNDVVEIDLHSGDQIVDFEEISADDYLLIRFDSLSRKTWLQRIRGGVSYRIQPPDIVEYALSHAWSIWAGNELFFCDAGGYMFIQSIHDDRVYKSIPHSTFHPTSLVYGMINAAAGTADNNVFFVGHFSAFVHYNGNGVIKYTANMGMDPDLLVWDVSVTASSVFAVGICLNDRRGVLIIGRKQ